MRLVNRLNRPRMLYPFRPSVRRKRSQQQEQRREGASDFHAADSTGTRLATRCAITAAEDRYARYAWPLAGRRDAPVHRSLYGLPQGVLADDPLLPPAGRDARGAEPYPPDD